MRGDPYLPLRERSALGNDAEVRRLLAGIDPLEALDLANELEPLPRIGAIRGTTPGQGVLVAPVISIEAARG